MSNNVPITFSTHLNQIPKSDTCRSKFPQIPHTLAFRKIKTCSTKFPKSFHTNNLLVGQLQFLWYNPFCSKKNLQKLKSHQFLQVNSSLFIFQKRHVSLLGECDVIPKKVIGKLFDPVGMVYFDGRKNITFNQYLLQNKEVL